MPQVIKLKAPNGQEWEQPTGLFIDNEFVDSSSPTNTISSIDPATEKEIAVVQAASEQDVDRAVQAAKKALKNPEWKQICVTERGRLMAKLAELMKRTRNFLPLSMLGTTVSFVEQMIEDTC
jgi:aldehyde dehydrogenase (NAD(P)+)